LLEDDAFLEFLNFLLLPAMADDKAQQLWLQSHKAKALQTVSKISDKKLLITKLEEVLPMVCHLLDWSFLAANHALIYLSDQHV
jgi:hypothetical protein